MFRVPSLALPRRHPRTPHPTPFASCSRPRLVASLPSRLATAHGLLVLCASRASHPHPLVCLSSLYIEPGLTRACVRPISSRASPDRALRKIPPRSTGGAFRSARRGLARRAGPAYVKPWFDIEFPRSWRELTENLRRRARQPVDRPASSRCPLAGCERFQNASKMMADFRKNLPKRGVLLPERDRRADGCDGCGVPDAATIALVLLNENDYHFMGNRTVEGKALHDR